MMRRIGLPVLVLVAAMLVTGVAWAGSGTAGSTYLDVFGIGIGAAPAAISAYTAAPGDVWSVTYNPAALANIERVNLAVSQIQWFEDTSYSFIGVGMPRGEGGLALGLAYFDLGSVDIFDETGSHSIDVADAYNFGVIGGYGFCIPDICDLHAGISGHVIQASYFDENATAIGLNFGVNYGMMENQVHVGAAVRNLGTAFKFVEEEDAQAMTIAGGISYNTLPGDIANVDVMVAGDVLLPKDQDMQFAAGAEIWVYNTLALRAGYKSGSEFGNLSYGAGFKYSDFQLDYTYADYEDLNATHRISLMMAFGD
jgi:hypothetical protein